MDDLNVRCLNSFPEWLRTLATDARDFASLLNDQEVKEEARLLVAGAINYLFKSLDLIPDGIEDLGYLDDAFVLRTAAKLAHEADSSLHDNAIVFRLSTEAELASELLGQDQERLLRYVEKLSDGAARGRTSQEIVTDELARTALLLDLADWAKQYTAPAFSRDEKNLTKLKSFFATKLPA